MKLLSAVASLLVLAACGATPTNEVRTRAPDAVVEGNGTVQNVADCLYPKVVEGSRPVTDTRINTFWRDNHTVAEIVWTNSDYFGIMYTIYPTDAGVRVEMRIGDPRVDWAAAARSCTA